MEEILSHPEIKDVSSIMLGTRDAHGLYERYGFKRISDSDIYMELTLEKTIP